MLPLATLEYIIKLEKENEQFKEYNEDYENAGFFKKVFSTVGLIATKFSEGLFGAGEQIVDGFASGVGIIVGIFDKDAKEAIGEFVKKGDTIMTLYYDKVLPEIDISNIYKFD